MKLSSKARGKFRRENWYGTGIVTKIYTAKLISSSLVWQSECTDNEPSL